MNKLSLIAILMILGVSTSLFPQNAFGTEGLEGGSTCILVLDSSSNKENIISWGESSSQAADNAFELCYEKYGEAVCSNITADQIYCRASGGWYNQ
jgi:hypothetical protein